MRADWIPRTAAFIASLGCAALIVAVARGLALRRALLDHPNDRSSHSTPRPRLGGIGVLAPILLAGAGLVAMGKSPPPMLVALGAMACIGILGLIDDLRPLPARVRFGVHVGCASVVVGIASQRLPSAAGALGTWVPVPVLAVLAVLWIVWLTNLFNFMDGIDGLAGAQALIGSLALAIVAAGTGAEASCWLLIALAGSSAGFLIFNFPPSSIFMGDVGSTAIGFFFGILPLLPEATPIPVEPVAMALALFVLDATLTLLRRVAAGEKWYTPHRTHLYQRPVVLGVGHRPVLLVATGAMVIVAGCAVAWSAASLQARLLLAVTPVLLYLAGRVLVARMARARRSRA